MYHRGSAIVSHTSVPAGCNLQRLEDILTELDETPLSPEDM